MPTEQLGNCPLELAAFRIVSEQSPAPSGPPLGAICAALHALTKPVTNESETVKTAAALGAPAIETRRLYSDLRHRSEFDSFTDVQNRFSLECYLDQQIEEAGQYPGIFRLIYIDLNELKQVNDVDGHRVGDMYVQEVTIRRRRKLRGVDRFARLGGDEFAALLPKVCNRAEVEEIAQRLESSFDEPYTFDGYVLHGSASMFQQVPG